MSEPKFTIVEYGEMAPREYPTSRKVGDTDHINAALNYVFCDDRALHLKAERERITRIYDAAIRRIDEMVEEQETEKARLRKIVKYQIAEETAAHAAAPTNLMTPSKELQK